MDNKPLDVEVRELLERRRGEWQRVADGAGVSHSWISQFCRGKIPNPGFATLTSLREFLARDQPRHMRELEQVRAALEGDGACAR